MKVSETTQKVYDGILGILKENGQPLTKAQVYAIESMVETVEEATEKRCCEVTESIIAKKDALIAEAKKSATPSDVVSEATMKKVNEMVEARIEQLKKDIPQVLDYAKMKKLESCMETIKECVGYRTDEQVERVANESAKMLTSTKKLMETQAKTISEKVASLAESTSKVNELQEQVKQMKHTIEAKDKQIVESTKKNTELVNQNQNLQKKIEESKKITESIEEKRKTEALRYYLEEKISKYPKYEATLLRKHFQNAKSRAEIDENFQKALVMVQEKRDAMRTVSAIPVAKAPSATKVVESNNKTISGETIVKESGGSEAEASPSMFDDSFVDIDLDNDVISNEDMQRWMSQL
jgi:uncharacterized ParB-like nuclease family protein